MEYTQITIAEYMKHKENEEFIKNRIEETKSDIDFWTDRLNFNIEFGLQTSVSERAIQRLKNELEYWKNRLLIEMLLQQI